MVDLLEAALGYAARGWPVFPCGENKAPLTAGGFKDATTDPARIRAWWGECPDANIGFSPGDVGLVAVDCDPGYDAEFISALPPTALSQQTPRGFHLFYQLNHGEAVKPSVGKVAKGVDIRSGGSYVILAPSRTGKGVYRWREEGRPAFRPQCLVDSGKLAMTAADRNEALIEVDLPENVAAAVRWLQGFPVFGLDSGADIAVEGAGGDARAVATAAMLRSLGVSGELALQLMLEHWNPRCDPPWAGDELDHLALKVANGYAHANGRAGDLTPAFRAAKMAAGFQMQHPPVAQGGKSRFRFTTREEMECISSPSWLVKDCIPQGGYAILYGSPGSYKTFIALDLALSVASGAAGVWGEVSQQPVLFIAGEGRSGLVNRVRAWEKTYLDGKRVRQFVLVDPVPLVKEAMAPFVSDALEQHPRYGLVVVDTVGRAMQGLNENTQEDASRFTAMVQALQSGLGCAVLGIHHTGHDNKTRTRGSSVFSADTDTMIRVERDDMRRVSLHMTKQKDAPEWEHPLSMRLETVLDSLTAAPDTRPVPARNSEKEDVSLGLVHVVDEAVAKELQNTIGRVFTTSALAQAVAMHDNIEVSSGLLRRKYLIDAREAKGTHASRCYDPATSRWRWVEKNKLPAS